MATDTKPRKPGRTGAAVPATPGTSGSPGAPGGAKTRQARPVSSPRHTRPVAPNPPRTAPAVRTAPSPATQPAIPPVIQPATQPGPSPAQREPRRPRQQRMPFILLLVGLLGGALVSLLVISTTLDAGAYRINNLNAQNTSLNKYIQMLTNQVANEKNPATIAQKATGYGMRREEGNRFLNLKTDKTSYVPPATP